jgi:hypothetical protein
MKLYVAAALSLSLWTAHSAVFDLEALMAMADREEQQRVPPPAQATPEQRAFIKKWSEVGPLFERQLALRRKIDDLINNIDELEYNEPKSWLDWFRKREDSPRIAILKRELKKAEKDLADVTGRIWKFYEEQAKDQEWR